MDYRIVEREGKYWVVNAREGVDVKVFDTNADAWRWLDKQSGEALRSFDQFLDYRARQNAHP
jgi:hypothetical protein